eukprot:2522770-Alexandrium_andersonii.AAC.1
MSASLVGSEMCIRDSLPPDDALVRHGDAYGLPSRIGRGLPPANAEVAACLLYTSDAADDM